MKTLWVVSAGPEACPAIVRARALGHRVVASDRDPRAPGLALADEGVRASAYEAEETLRAARAFVRRGGPIHGVLCVAADAPATAAALVEEFGLVGVTRRIARLATDKLAMKERFLADGIPVPWFSPVEGPEHLAELARWHDPPLVLKPVDSRGARGVLRLDRTTDRAWAWSVAAAHSRSGRVMVERFVPGPQLSTESLVVEGEVATPGLADRNYEHLERFAPYVIEDGGQLPTALAGPVVARVREVVARAAASLGVRNGVVKGDLVIEDGQPVVIELAARLSGGYFCSHHIPLSTGVDFLGQAIRLALGDEVLPRDLEPRFQRGVAQRFLFPEPGQVCEIRGVDEVSRRPDIAFCEVRLRPGDVVPPVRDHPSRAGLVIATGETREEAVSRAREAVRTIEIRTRPEGGVAPAGPECAGAGSASP